MTVADHLAASRDAHVRYRTIHDTTKNADTPNLRAAIQDALDHRQAAHDADRAHDDPAWGLNVFDGKAATHAALVHFYETFLATH